jgi:hypothetical protein
MLSPSESSYSAVPTEPSNPGHEQQIFVIPKPHPVAVQVQSVAAMEPMQDPAYFGAPAAVMSGIPDDMVYFDPTHTLFQEMEFGQWDLNFDGFTVPTLEVNGPSPQSTGTAHSKPSLAAARDPSRAHQAFKRSPWIWEPELKDYVRQEKEGLFLDENNVGRVPAFERMKSSQRLKISSRMRDRLLAVVLAQNKDPTRIPPFPSLDILNYLLQAHFVHDDHQYDSWIHVTCIKGDDTMPELLAAIVSNGAVLIAVPDIWRFGLALQEVVRLSLPILVCLPRPSSRIRETISLTSHSSLKLRTRILVILAASKRTCSVSM